VAARVRWPLVAGGVSAATTVVGMFWPPTSGRLTAGWFALGLLLTLTCLAAAVAALPGRQRRRVPVVIVAAVSLAFGIMIGVVGDRRHSGVPGLLLGPADGSMVALLAAGVAITAAVIAGYRAGAGWVGWLAPAGCAVLGAAALLLIGAGISAQAVYGWTAYTPLNRDEVSSVAILVGERPHSTAPLLIEPGPFGVNEPGFGVVALLVLGVVLATIGCVRAVRDAR
jgi:hypothetical protein